MGEQCPKITVEKSRSGVRKQSAWRIGVHHGQAVGDQGSPVPSVDNRTKVSESLLPKTEGSLQAHGYVEGGITPKPGKKRGVPWTDRLKRGGPETYQA